MNEEKPAWANQLADTPFASRRFTAELKHQVLRRTEEPHSKRFSIMKTVGLPLVLALLVIGSLSLAAHPFPSKVDPQAGVSGGPATRNTYYEQGRPVFSLYPDPYARAGTAAGYMISFEDPLDTFKGKTLTLYAVHRLSGVKETVSSEVITKPSPGYPGLERYTVRFALPLAGIWELYVRLDDKPYGNVELYLPEPSWDVTPEFRSGASTMRGVEKRVGFIDTGFTAAKSQTYTWHFWGNDDLLNGPFEVKAVKQGTDKIVDVYASDPLSSANALAGELNGADRHVVVEMKLPEAGRWRLLPYVRGRLLDTIVVEVAK